LLVASAVAAAIGQLRATPRGPWISMGLSAAAIVVTALAIFSRRE
jgi:hypothetical protein